MTAVMYERPLEEARRQHHAPDRLALLARGLGWFSIGLGIAEIVAPGTVARLIGARNDRRTRRLLAGLGVREVASGIGILTRSATPGWLWARVGGDAMDLAFLGSRLRARGTTRNRLAIAAGAVAGVTLLDALAGRKLGQRDNGAGARPRAARGIYVNETITVNRAPDEVYRFWRDFENLPRFMEHLESVQVLDSRRSRWKAKAPAGRSVEWEAEIVDDRPNELIAWRSLPHSDVPNAGTVRFVPAPAGGGTEVHVVLRYDPPAGAIGAAIAKLFGKEPSQQVQGDLHRFKQVLETGEVIRSDASIHRGLHPARPSAAPM